VLSVRVSQYSGARQSGLHAGDEGKVIHGEEYVFRILKKRGIKEIKQMTWHKFGSFKKTHVAFYTLDNIAMDVLGNSGLVDPIKLLPNRLVSIPPDIGEVAKRIWDTHNTNKEADQPLMLWLNQYMPNARAQEGGYMW
jgi:hypothetical protein